MLTPKERFPELYAIAERLANETCDQINRKARDVQSEMPYKTQFILEHVIEILARRV